MIQQSDLIVACEAALGERLDWFLADWIDGRATFDYAITSVEKTPIGCDVAVARIGTGRFPVLVEATTASGETLRQRVDRDEAQRHPPLQDSRGPQDRAHRSGFGFIQT